MQCLVAAGLGPKEDPSAPGPHGKTAKISDIAANAMRARSKWTNQTVIIAGTVAKVSTRDNDTALVISDQADPTKTIDATLYRTTNIEVGAHVIYQCEVMVSITAADDTVMPTGFHARLSYCRSPEATSARR
jgi:hypothetical protein